MPLNRLCCCDAREPLSMRASGDTCNTYVPTNERRSVLLYRHVGALDKAMDLPGPRESIASTPSKRPRAVILEGRDVKA
jgi:hypothetical protein